MAELQLPFDRRDEAPKHDLWIVPYADMITLLFALFVILYAGSAVDARKFERLRYSLWSAFGDGTGTFESGAASLGEDARAGGDLAGEFDLINSQRAQMFQFVERGLLESFEKVAGRSLDVAILDDTIRMSAPVGSVFAAGEARLRPGIEGWLYDLLDDSTTLASEIRIALLAPRTDGPVGANGESWIELCDLRERALKRLVDAIPQVDLEQCRFEFGALPRSLEPFEAVARIEISFANP